MKDLFMSAKRIRTHIDETIKSANEQEEWVWVEGYKGTDKNMKCRDQQYELGKTYVMPEDSTIEACKSGFHLCLGLIDVFEYYSVGNGNRFFKVRALVRKSDLDNQEEPKIYLSTSNPHFMNAFRIPNITFNSTSNSVQVMATKENKLAAKSIEFVSELTMDEIFENTLAKDWSEEDKKLALIDSLYHVENIIQARELEKKRQEQEDTLVELGYSRAFATYITKDGKYEKAYAVGTQSDLSMDMKVLAILMD